MQTSAKTDDGAAGRLCRWCRRGVLLRGRRRNCLVFECAAFPRRRIGDDAVNLAPFVAFGKVFGDRHPVFSDKEQAVAVFVDLHFVAGADPAPQLGFGLFVLVEIAGAQRLAEFIDMHGQTFDDRLGHGGVGMHSGPALLGETFHELYNFLKTLLFWFSHGMLLSPAAVTAASG
jgi:hypothetical protein